MLIGFTYDLRSDYIAEGYSPVDAAEYDSETTVDAIATALEGLGHRVERIGHARALMKRLVDGGRWDLVFNICEGRAGFGRESLVPALLDDYGIPYTFSDPLVCALTLHKALAKQVLRDSGVPVANFALVERVADAAAVDLPYPLFVKPVAEGTGKGIDAASRVANRDELTAICRQLIARFAQPALVETWLPGRELTVGIVGTGPAARALGTLEINVDQSSEHGIYSFANKDNYEDCVGYALLDEPDLRAQAERIALQAWQALGCRDAGRVDLRLDAAGVPNVLEINPLAGLHPIDSDLPILCRKLGVSFETLIADIVASAATRCAPAAVAAVA